MPPLPPGLQCSAQHTVRIRMNLEPATLIGTKLHRPSVTDDLVPRPRLTAMLDRSHSCALTLVCAGAGFGKTTLVSSWLAAREEDGRVRSPASGGSAGRTRRTAAYAWLSLDDGDSDLSVFLRYFVAAVRTAFPESCAEARELAHAQELPSLAMLDAAVVNGLASLPAPLLLVIDDYQSVRGESVHELLGRMLRHWPDNVHLVLISRTSPPLPLAGLRAGGRLNEIRSRDLRFSKVETAAFLSRALPVRLSQSDLDVLEKRYEGWIVGLRLAVLSMRDARRSADIRSGALTGDRQALEYLVDEVIALQPAVIQRFLLRTSVLDRFCAPLCDAVVPPEGPEWTATACLDWIEQANLLVVALDGEGRWHRYHHLFQQALRDKLRETHGAEELARLHRSAAGWLAARGYVDEAIQHALAAPDLELAAALMEQGLRDVLNRVDRLTIERWLRLVPEKSIEARPQLLMLRIWDLVLSWRLEALATLIQRVEALLAHGDSGGSSPDELRVMRGQLLALHSQSAYLRGEMDRAAELARAALSLLPSSWEYVSGGATMYLALAMQARGELDAADSMLRNEYAAHAGEASGYALRMLMAMCLVRFLCGEAGELERSAATLLKQASSGGPLLFRSWAHYFLGVSGYDQNDLGAASRHFEAVIESRHVSQALTVSNSYCGLALVQHAAGDAYKAGRTLDRLSEFDLRLGGAEQPRTRSLRARLMLLEGDVEGASRWEATWSAPLQDHAMVWLEDPHVTKARIRLARGGCGDVEVAGGILDRVYETACRTHNVRAQVEIQVLRAAAMDLLGREDGATDALRQAIDLAWPRGILRFFLDGGPRVERLLRRVADNGHAAGFVRGVLAAFEDAAGASGSATTEAPAPSRLARNVSGLIEKLTPRELEVLALLGQPLSGKEIARQLDISHATAKRHIANIYGKLGVSSRAEAVRAARARGMLAQG